MTEGGTDIPQRTALDPDHEIAVECVGCGQYLIVGGYVDDLDPALYRCLSCRPMKPQPRDPNATSLADAIARAKAAQR